MAFPDPSPEPVNSAESAAPGIFPDTGIFRYHNGQREVCADPVVLYRRLLRAVGQQDINRLLDTIAPADPNIKQPRQLVDDAWETLATAACTAFGLTPLDANGNGLTENRQMEVLFEYLSWMDGVKKNGRSPPNSSPRSTSSFPDASLYPTKAPSDSGLTVGG